MTNQFSKSMSPKSTSIVSLVVLFAALMVTYQNCGEGLYKAKPGEGDGVSALPNGVDKVSFHYECIGNAVPNFVDCSNEPVLEAGISNIQPVPPGVGMPSFPVKVEVHFSDTPASAVGGAPPARCDLQFSLPAEDISALRTTLSRVRYRTIPADPNMVAVPEASMGSLWVRFEGFDTKSFLVSIPYIFLPPVRSFEFVQAGNDLALFFKALVSRQDLSSCPNVSWEAKLFPTSLPAMPGPGTGP